MYFKLNNFRFAYVLRYMYIVPMYIYFLVHVSEYIDCGTGCLTFCKEDICQANYSDHNIYAVCLVSRL